MNSDTDIHPGLDDYLARVRTALADLPADELAEVLEDIEPHVTEVFGEPGDPVDRLGSPEDYAAELRAAGGYPPVATPPTAVSHGGLGRFVFWIVGLTAVLAAFIGLVALMNRAAEPLVVFALCLPLFGPALWLVLAERVNRSDIADLPEYRRARRIGDSMAAMFQPDALAYVRSLRPAWALARIIVLVLAFLAAIDRAPGLAVFVLVVAGGLLWTAGRTATNRRLLAITVPANAFVIGAALALAIGVADSNRGGGPVADYQGYTGGGLVYGGNRLSNVYAVGADGRPIEEFYLYDETGTPITVDHESCGKVDPSPRIRNRLPVPRVVYVNGYCETRTDMPFVPLAPGGSTSPSVTSGPPSVSGSAVSPSVSATSPAISVTPTK
ncbi:Proline-rich protein [Alloactinosynnema sp. L-07]|uniref:DUF1700 domain-containing protein n=1 Tax=Alloactinosynnema sp. L-07 TaxID=1653480 RepID=UPI00065EFEEE|nr:hypothetical protein [Alloactinosynnema sp. L-07]CRK58657.1 Proline-rich protein [Alloactinosynnema sp. L-07]